MVVVVVVCLRVRDENVWFGHAHKAKTCEFHFSYTIAVSYDLSNCFCPLFLNFCFARFIAHYIPLGKLSSECRGRLHFRRSLGVFRSAPSGLISRTAVSNQAFCRRIRKVSKTSAAFGKCAKNSSS